MVKGTEIAVVVEEWKAVLDTEGGDPTIHNLADGEPLGSKLAIIQGALNRVATADHWLKHEHASLPQLSPDLNEDSERVYGLAIYHLSGLFEIGEYDAIVHADVNDQTPLSKILGNTHPSSACACLAEDFR